jgi:chemotaxis protein MotB
MAEEQQPIYVIKKIVKGGGHHGGAWKVAYADFVTAMMAFFMVLWLLSSSEEVQKSVGGYFSDPEGTGKMVGTQQSGAGGESISLAANDMDKLKDKLEAAMKETPQFQKIKEQVKMVVTGEGLRVELLESDTGTFFESGSPAPTERATVLLGTLAQEIGKLPNKVFIEGHTDSKPFTGDYTNWELSSDRANTARRIVQMYGVRPDQVAQVRGFADQTLRLADNPSDASNRRISIIIKYLDQPVGAKKAEHKDDHKGGEHKGGDHKTDEHKADEHKAEPEKKAAAH